MRCLPLESRQDVAWALADLVLDEVKKKPALNLGLSGEIFLMPAFFLFRDRLVASMVHKEVNFRRVRFFATHEYCPLGIGNPESNAYSLWHRLIKLLDAYPDNVFLLNGSTLDPEEECHNYENLIKSCGGIDLLLLTLGPRGEIACNEAASSLGSRCRRKILYPAITISGRRFTGGWKPEAALTMGVATIMDARRIALPITGSEHSTLATRILDGPITASVTASVLQGHRHVEVYLDKAAACYTRASRAPGLGGFSVGRQKKGLREEENNGAGGAAGAGAVAGKETPGKKEAPEEKKHPSPGKVDIKNLWNAVVSGNRDEVLRALELGASPNTRDEGGVTLLHLASGKGKIEVARVLIDAGADINRRDHGGATPLQWALFGRHHEVIALLRRHDAER